MATVGGGGEADYEGLENLQEKVTRSSSRLPPPSHPAVAH